MTVAKNSTCTPQKVCAVRRLSYNSQSKESLAAKYLMRKTILLYGMKRSGNHGIINWLRSQSDFVFCNNIVPIAPQLRGEQAFPRAVDFGHWLEQRHAAQVKGDDFSCVNKPPGQRLTDCDVLASLEDQAVSHFPFQPSTASFKSILVIRDPVNMLASRIKKAARMNHPAYPRTTGPLMDAVIQTWKGHAREFLNQTNHLPNRTNIYFNAWFSDQNYRKSISRQLNLEFSDAGFATVSQEGGGSSFEGTSHSGANHNMQVLNRISLLNEDQQNLLRELLKDTQIQELADAIEASIPHQIKAG